MSYYSGSEGYYICDRCGTLLPGDLMVWLDNGEIYCGHCYDRLCAKAEAGEQYEEYYNAQNGPWLQNLPAVAKQPHSLFMSQLPPKQRTAFMDEIKAGRDPFLNESLMARTQSLKARNFNSVRFTTFEDNPSIICGIGFVAVRDGKIVGRRKQTLSPDMSFKKFWKKCMNEHDYGLVPFVSYNAYADRACLKATLKANCMDDPDWTFIDANILSKKYFKTKLTDFQLKTVAGLCKYELREQHSMLNEAEAIAMIAMKAIPISELL